MNPQPDQSPSTLDRLVSEFCAAVGEPVPTDAIAAIKGLREANRKLYQEWSDLTGDYTDLETEVNRLREAIHDRGTQKDPMNDIQRLIQQVDDLSEDRIVRNARIRALELEVERLRAALVRAVDELEIWRKNP